MSAKSQRQRDQEAARKFWESLDNGARWLLGDGLVLGDLDWRDWFHAKPSRAFMNELDQERIHWESESEAAS